MLDLADRLDPNKVETKPPLWKPLAGPQTQAYNSLADELFYGGAAGGGKSDLLLGLALTAHRDSIIFRREFTQLKHLIKRSKQVIGRSGRYNGTEHSWQLGDGRYLEFGALQLLDDVDKYQGRPHDLVAFDELPNFLKAQYEFVIGWARTPIKGQRVRVVGAGNPPDPNKPETLWVIERFAAWLDDQHPNPAEPGELRWYARVDDEWVEVENGTPFVWKGEEIMPSSRTFIPARVTDNPYSLETGYVATLQKMPEPLRSQLLYGDFSIGVEDDPWQVIPTQWIRDAQERWRKSPEKWRNAGKWGRRFTAEGKPVTLSAAGVDVARGGKDESVIARRYGNWFAKLECHPGTSTPDGDSLGEFVVAALQEGGTAQIDGIGVGGSVYDYVKREKPGRAKSVIFSEAAKDEQGKPYTDKSESFEFANMRAYAYWSMREALDPDTGDNLALPPDQQLLADLCAPRWSERTGRILVESKEDISKRLGGRSTDRGDAVVLARLPAPRPPQKPYVGPPRQQAQGFR